MGTVERNTSSQKPKPKLYKRKGKPGIWKTQYRRYLADGTLEKPWETFGDTVEFPTLSKLTNSQRYTDFIERINNIRVVVFFKDLCLMYREEEIKKWSPHFQTTSKGNMIYLEDRWGEIRVDEIIRSGYDLRSWLEGDLTLRSDKNKPEGQRRQASRQTRKHLRRLLVAMLSYAVEKNYLPYNPFVGTALTVKKGGEAPVDRSRFFISPQMFRFMMEDPQTPDHIKMMLRLAYIAGMRAGEFLGLRWEEIEFDGEEPEISIKRSVRGKHINDTTNKSKKSVPMCDLLGAALLCYKDDNPSFNGWVFGSATTKGPIWPDSLREDHLWPALLRMAAKFRLRVPDGSGFHSFRHAYYALVGKVGNDAAQIRKVQMELLRHGSEQINKRYGKSAPTVREQARVLHAEVAELAMGVEVN